MSSIDKRLESLGISLPVKNRKGTGVVDAVIKGELLFISAQLPLDAEGTPVYTGKVGTDLTPEQGYEAARLCGMNTLAVIREYVGELDRVDSFVKVLGLVNSGADFSGQPGVINGYSDLMVEVFGARGRHARSAMGAYALPKNSAVTVDAIVKLR